MAQITFDPSNLASGINLNAISPFSDLAYTDTGAAAAKITRTVNNLGITSGKYYFEMNCSPHGTGGVIGVGVCNPTESKTNGLGATGSNSVGYYMGNAAVVFNGAVITSLATNTTDNLVVCVAVDFTGQLIWWRLNGGNWNNNGANNPATGVGGISFAGFSGPYLPACSTFNQGGGRTNNIIANFGATSYAQSAPSGFASFTTTTDAQLDFNRTRLKWDQRIGQAYTFEDDDDQQRLFIKKGRPQITDNSNTLQVSKFLQFDVIGPPDADVSISKFNQYDVLAPPDADVSASKFLNYVVMETLPSIIRPMMLELERRIINPWAQFDDEDTNAYRLLTMRLRQTASLVQDAFPPISGVAGIGHVGSLSIKVDKTLTGVAGTAHVGSLIASGITLAGVQGTAHTGTLSLAIAKTLTGVGATAGIGGVLVSIDGSQPIFGVGATGQVGSLLPTVSKALTGVAGTAHVGSLTPTVQINLTGVQATGAVGTLTVNHEALPLVGVFATAGIGRLTATTGHDVVNINLDSVFGIARVGTLTVSHSGQVLTGVQATAQVGTLTPIKYQPGMTLTALTVIEPQVSMDAIEVSLRTSRTKGASWDNAREQSLGLTGELLKNISWRRIGLARDLIAEVSWSAPVNTSLTGVFISYTDSST